MINIMRTTMEPGWHGPFNTVRQSIPCAVFMGRFQPFHNGHVSAINTILQDKQDIHCVIAAIHGNTCQDSRSPFIPDYVIQAIRTVIVPIYKNTTILSTNAGYLGFIFTTLRNEGLEPVAMIAGSDRLPSYRAQITKINQGIPNEDGRFIVDIVRQDRVASASNVRKAILDNDYSTFTALMPVALHGEYRNMRSAILNLSK